MHTRLKMNPWLIRPLLLAALLPLVACGDDTTDPSPGELVVPATYTFESKFEAGESSVSYDGQIARHILIVELQRYIEGLSAQIDSAAFQPTDDAQVMAALNFYVDFDSASNGEETLSILTTPATMQATYNAVSTNKKLRDKIAGNDPSTDHVDWKSAFKGWSDTTIAAHGGAVTSPEGLLTAFLETIEQNAIARTNGVVRMGPGGVALPVHVTESGLDLSQLTQKFLTAAITFHQGVDDYLDDDKEGKGLLSDNTKAVEGKPYTELEHAWDEGFGYFGAARNYNDYTDDELAAAGGRDGFKAGYHDANNDQKIDLLTEYSFGHSTNAAKRDRGSKDANVDMTKDAFDAFLRGRAIITHAAGRALSAEEMVALKAQRDKAERAWESAIASTALHYINDVLRDMELFGAADYKLLDHAKHWGELKGFALGLQFSPRSPLTDAQFTQLHTLLGDAPVLATASAEQIAAYKTSLIAARKLLADAYGFPEQNLGDEKGVGGW
jgi:hypothetical protein